MASAIYVESINSQLTGVNIVRLSRAERFNLDDILAKGVGYCSQESIALQLALANKGVDSSVITLDGHVIVEANYNEKKWVLDPYYII